MELNLPTWGYYFPSKVQTVGSETIRSLESPQYKSTLRKIIHIFFNVLGYLPLISLFTGTIRMSFHSLNACICLITEKRISNFNSEMQKIFRGALEAFLPYGKLVNLGLDIVLTIKYYNNIPSKVTIPAMD